MRHDRNEEYGVSLLDNPQHEKFSQLVASGVKPNEDAFRRPPAA
jgi:hypothetical protein